MSIPLSQGRRPRDSLSVLVELLEPPRVRRRTALTRGTDTRFGDRSRVLVVKDERYIRLAFCPCEESR